jgi:hypothetical protein
MFQNLEKILKALCCQRIEKRPTDDSLNDNRNKAFLSVGRF